MKSRALLFIVLSSLALVGSITYGSLLESHSFSERECIMCRFSVGLVNYALSTKVGTDQVYKVANSFCTMAHISSPIVCSNATKLFNKEIVKVLSSGVVTPDQICGLISKNTCGHFHDPLANWEVNLNVSSSLNHELLSEARRLEGYARKSREAIKVIHISDTHVDLKYKEGSPNYCGEPLCCRVTSTPSLTDKSKAGYWGSYGSCDVPLRTFENLLKTINRSMTNEEDIQYIIWTGDIQPHDIWEQNQKSALKLYDIVFTKIFQYLPNVRIFPTFGNHEMVPVDSFSPSNLLSIARDDSPEWLYKKFQTYWSRWLPMDTIRTISKDGFYSVSLDNGLKIISLNTNFCHTINFWLYIDSVDPGSQLKWLIHELQLSELAHENVHIIGHIPPGSSDCLKVWSRNFSKIVRRFSNTITGQFYGHTHNNEFKVYYNHESSFMDTKSKNSRAKRDTEEAPWQPVSVGFVGSSLTTFINVNPGFSIYTMDPNQGYLPIDFETYFMNLTDSNIAGSRKEPVWTTFGPFTKIFSVNDTSPKSMHNLLVSIASELQEDVGDEQFGFLNSTNDLLNRQVIPHVLKKFSSRPLDVSSNLYKLYRLYHTYSDKFEDTEIATLFKRKQFICKFFTAESKNIEACNKFIRGLAGTTVS